MFEPGFESESWPPIFEDDDEATRSEFKSRFRFPKQIGFPKTWSSNPRHIFDFFIFFLLFLISVLKQIYLVTILKKVSLKASNLKRQHYSKFAMLDFGQRIYWRNLKFKFKQSMFLKPVNEGRFWNNCF